MIIANRIYSIIIEKNLKQSAVARAAGYDVKKFNNMLKGRKKIYADDIPNICKVLAINPNELFQMEEVVKD